MIEVLQIIAGSWPIAVMVLGLIAGSIVVYFIHWIKKSDQDDKAYRSSQAVVVRNRDDE